MVMHELEPIITETESVLVYGPGFNAHYRQLSSEMQRAADMEMSALIPEIAAFIYAAKAGQLEGYVRNFPGNAGLVSFITNMDTEVVLVRGSVSFTVQILDGAFSFSKVIARLLH
jgi:phosphoserine phosphatase